jgi:hypothetical protein
MDETILDSGHDHGEPASLAQAPKVEILLHRVRGREQADALQPAVANRFSGRVGDMDERHVGRRRDRVRDLVHGVGAEDEQLCAGRDEHARLVSQPNAGLLPPPLPLQAFELRKVDRSEQAIRGVQAAAASTDLLVEQAVILARGLPAHPAEEPDPLHARRAPG